MYWKLITTSVVLGVLIAATLLFAGRSHAQGSSAPQDASRGLLPDERKLVKSNWKREPVKINELRVKGSIAEFGRAFREPDDDWLKGFSLNVTNTSNKDIVYVEVSLTLFGEEERLTPSRTPTSYPVFYGSPEGIFDGSTKAHAIRPNESVDVSFTDEEYDKFKEYLLDSDYPARFRHVTVQLDTVVFADGTLWYKSYYFYRDPKNPNNFVRDKYFQKVPSNF